MPEVHISRPTPPRAEDYAVVLGSQGPRRDFRISVGLREGWDAEGRVFDVSEAVRTRSHVKPGTPTDKQVDAAKGTTNYEISPEGFTTVKRKGKGEPKPGKP